MAASCGERIAAARLRRAGSRTRGSSKECSRTMARRRGFGGVDESGAARKEGGKANGGGGATDAAAARQWRRAIRPHGLGLRFFIGSSTSPWDFLKLNHPETQVGNEPAYEFLTLLKEWERLCKEFSLLGTETSKKMFISTTCLYDNENVEDNFKVPSDVELCRACVDPLVTIPHVGVVAYYFPQGHLEQGRGFPTTEMEMRNLNRDGGEDRDKISYPRGEGAPHRSLIFFPTSHFLGAAPPRPFDLADSSGFTTPTRSLARAEFDSDDWMNTLISNNAQVHQKPLYRRRLSLLIALDHTSM
ncbi:hypothetical protein Scep_025729 [Stephania cephalantha]|uniref:Uncharacterized protein n=1 Tax=Stephania cephalantha TaxID=152367 RepID=A0AAP0HSQ3_9MAGN